MNIVLECDVVLSKKIEAVCDDGEPISIYITGVSGNKGRALVRISCKAGVSDKDVLKIGETSLMFKINSASDDVKSLDVNVGRVSNLVGGIPTAVEAAFARTSPHIPEGQPYVDPRPVPAVAVEYVRPAAPQPPVVAAAPSALAAPASPFDAMVGNPEALRLIMAAMAAAGLPVPQITQAPSQTMTAQAPKPQVRDNCIMSYDELMAELNSLPGVDNMPRMPTDRKMTPREAESILSQMPRLRKKAYLRNMLQSQLMIGDLFTTIEGTGFCLAMLPGAAFDLTRLPARNILNSTDLKFCFDTGKVEMVNSAMYAASFKKIQEDADRNEPVGLPVFSGDARTSPHDSSGGMAESVASGSAMTDDRDAIHIGGSGGAEPISIAVNTGDDRPPENVYEENSQMQALIGGLPTARQVAPSAPRRMR